MAYAISFFGTGEDVRFTFLDARDNQFSVILTPRQVNEYRDALDGFSTEPLKKKDT